MSCIQVLTVFSHFSCLEYFVDRSYSMTFQTCIIVGGEIEISIHGCNNNNMFHRFQKYQVPGLKSFIGARHPFTQCSVAEFLAPIYIASRFEQNFL